VQKPSLQLVLFDDVMTSGNQMIGSYRGLAASGIKPIRAVAIGRTVHEQKNPMIEWREEEIETEGTLVDWKRTPLMERLLPNCGDLSTNSTAKCASDISPGRPHPQPQTSRRQRGVAHHRN
jgi:hypothetical protein